MVTQSKRRVVAHGSTSTSSVSESSGDFAQLFEASLANEIKEGSVVIGKVVAIEKGNLIVDIGLKMEGMVPVREFAVDNEVPAFAVGDDVEVYLERQETKSGRALLSREKAIRQRSWVAFESAFQNGERVEGTIFGRIKGGYAVDLAGVAAFLPGSQVDIRPVKDIQPLMGTKQPFVILKMDRESGNIVVSRRVVLEESRAGARDALLSSIHEGIILEGVVKNITDYGAFVDLGSIDGLLHVTDISWKRISHPSEVLSVGQTVRVMVIKYNIETHRVSLGMKQLGENPWSGAEARFPISQRFKGHVTNITDYGVFVELEPGIEGLVHVSEISWNKTSVHPRKLVSIGQEVTVMILDIDPVKHRISLGMKQCEDNPWSAFAQRHPVGSVVEGTIRNIVDFGFFVGVDHEVDGLVHINDLSWDRDAQEELKKYAKDDVVKVKVLTVDIEKERVSLGIKQLDRDPFEEVASKIEKGATLTCTVIAHREDGLEVEVRDGVTALIKKSDLSRDRIEQRVDRFSIGNRIDVKVVGVDVPLRRINLSIKAFEIDEQRRAIEEFGSTDSGASLGDILGAALYRTRNQNPGA